MNNRKLNLKINLRIVQAGSLLINCFLIFYIQLCTKKNLLDSSNKIEKSIKIYV